MATTHAATRAWRAWMREFKKQGVASDAVTRFTTLDLNGRPMRPDGDLRSPNPAAKPPVRRASPGHGQAGADAPATAGCQKEEMDRLSRAKTGLVRPGPHDHGVPQALPRRAGQAGGRIGVRPGPHAPEAKISKEILGDKLFPNPKDVNVIARWLHLAMPDRRRHS